MIITKMLMMKMARIGVSATGGGLSPADIEACVVTTSSMVRDQKRGFLHTLT